MSDQPAKTKKIPPTKLIARRKQMTQPEDRVSLKAKAGHLLIEAYTNGEKVTKAEILKRAGFPKSALKDPRLVFQSPEAFEVIDEFVEKMKEHRNEILDLMRKKFKKANFRDLAYGLNIINQHINLLEGRPTSRVSIPLEAEKRKEIDNLLQEAKIEYIDIELN